APLLAAVCDHAAPDVHSENALAKINTAAMRILFTLQLIPPDVCPFARAVSGLWT
ncbi:MAG: hypothetical protein QOI87_3117, partial [Bradyrhizobium sp.]|nr:hypothetical protein [Bradyrhizobium sp.]